MIGPIEHIAIKPKLSSLHFFDTPLANPIPRAIINGTVIGPVVTPPESKATALKSAGTKIARINTTI